MNGCFRIFGLEPRPVLAKLDQVSVFQVQDLDQEWLYLFISHHPHHHKSSQINTAPFLL